jgi:hypothetical protein
MAGKQPKMRSTIIKDASCLGPYGAKLAVGDEQSMVFLAGETPWYARQVKPFERTEAQHLLEPCFTAKEIEAHNKKVKKLEAAREEGDTAPVHCPLTAPGCLGEAKGLKQIAWERGFWKEGMMKSKTKKEEDKLRVEGKPVPDPSLYVDLVLNSCADFMEEKSALADLIESRGHIALVGVKCHPEIAGVGVEYTFGMSKRYFRKNNDQVTAHLQANVEKSLQSDVLPLSRLWKFERRTWQYMMMYRDLYKNGVITEATSFEKLESKMREMKTTHRNILDIELKYLKRVESSTADD